MAIEQDLKRMADAQERTAVALEAILGYVKGGVAAVKETKGLAALSVPAPVVAAPVAPVVVKAEAPVVAQVTPVSTAPGIFTGEELRMQAQAIAQKLGPKTLEFTAWVMKDVLGVYGVKTMLEVPADKIAEASAKLAQYAKEKGV